MSIYAFFGILVLASLLWLIVCEIMHWLPRPEQDDNDRVL